MNAVHRRRVQWGIAVAALTALVWYVGPAELLSTLRTMRPLPVLGYFAAFLCVPFLYGWQLHGALRRAGTALPTRDVVRAVVQSWSIGTLTPARAGDLSLAYFLGGRLREADAIAVVAVDKVASLVTLATLAVLSAAMINVPYAPLLAVGTGLVLGVSMSLLAVVTVPGADSPIRALARRLLGVRGDEGWQRIREVASSPRVIVWSLAMTMLRWGYICVIGLIIFRAVGATPALGAVIAATAVGRIISIVPISIGGLGIKEPAQILIYATVGVSAEAVVAVSIVGTACGFAVAALAPALVRADR